MFSKITIIALAMSAQQVFAQGNSGGGGQDKVTICHGTASDSNPYRLITVAVGAQLDGHFTDSHNTPNKYPDAYPGDTVTYEGNTFVLDDDCCPSGFTCDSGVIADPHMKSWSGEWFDYMGECDLVLMQAPEFDGKQNMDIHVRTTIRYDYSFIEAAAVRIGNDILEVASWGEFAINGVEGAGHGNKNSVPSVGDYPVYHNQVSNNKHTFDIVIGHHENITLSTFKDWVSVTIKNGHEEHFQKVTGFMGSIDGAMLSRTGKELRGDINALGQDWQVIGEDKLFRTTRAPQAPEQCRLPTKSASATRRLGETVAEEAANKACAHLTGNAFGFCVHDTMASGDLELATSGAF